MAVKQAHKQQAGCPLTEEPVPHQDAERVLDYGDMFRRAGGICFGAACEQVDAETGSLGAQGVLPAAATA
jgi:hypothetical protein